MLVGKRMTPNPITIKPDVPIAEALEWMRREKVRRFPVVDKDGKLIGIIARSDLLHAAPSSVTSLNVWEVTYLLSQVKVEEVMTKEVITICEDCPVEEAARIMADNKVGGLPVMRDDADGSHPIVVGIITESDLFKAFLEVFGAREKGVRMTLLAPYFRGSLAQISSTITEHGGLIVALNVFLGEDPSNWGCVLKVSDISKDKLVEIVEPLAVEILDVREM
jgi:acetoin utilization protein AcuB